VLPSDKETTEVDICLTSKAHSLLYWFISAEIGQGVISGLFLALSYIPFRYLLSWLDIAVLCVSSFLFHIAATERQTNILSKLSLLILRLLHFEPALNCDAIAELHNNADLQPTWKWHFGMRFWGLFDELRCFCNFFYLLLFASCTNIFSKWCKITRGMKRSAQ
jgi:hypothetical protein